MELGTGIAIAGIWIFAGMMGMSRSVTGLGTLVAVLVAIAMTITLK